MYVQKESVRGILVKLKRVFSNFKGFHNEHGYISNTAVTDTESQVLQLDVSCYTGEMLS